MKVRLLSLVPALSALLATHAEGRAPLATAEPLRLTGGDPLASVEPEAAGELAVLADLQAGEVLYVRTDLKLARAVQARAAVIAEATGMPAPVLAEVRRGEEVFARLNSNGVFIRGLRHSTCHEFGPARETTSCDVNCGPDTRVEPDGRLVTYYVNESPMVRVNKQCIWSDNRDDYCIDEAVAWCQITTFTDNQCQSAAGAVVQQQGMLCGQ